MATGDITTRIEPNGFFADVTTAGFTTGASYNLAWNTYTYGTVTISTFAAGHTITQVTTGATMVIQSVKVTGQYTYLYCGTVTGTPNQTANWTDNTSSALLTVPNNPNVSQTVLPYSPTASTPYFTVVSLGYDATGAATTKTRTVYLTTVARFPYLTGYLTGTYTSGTFVDGDVITQAVSGATGQIVGDQSAGTKLVFFVTAGTFNNVNLCTGPTGTFTSTSTFTAYAALTKHEESTAVPDLTTRFSLSEYVYQKDNTGAGNSLTAPTFTSPAGFIVNSGGGAQSSNAASAIAVTQSSTAAFPLVLMNWDTIAGVRTADRVTGSFTVAVNARHRFGIAAVVITATGQTSAYTTTFTQTTQVSTVRTATGLYYSAYQGTISIAGFTLGELIDIRAQVYPSTGDLGAVMDTNSFTTALNECLGYNKATVVYSTTNTDKYVALAASTPAGNDANAGTSAAPYLTIGKAVSAGANRVFLKDGSTFLGMGSNPVRTVTNEWVIVQPDPVSSPSGVIFQMDDVQFNGKCSRLMFYNLTIKPKNINASLYGAALANYLRFNNVTFNLNGVARITGGTPFYQWYGVYFENCPGDLGYNWYIAQIGNYAGFTFDGCVFGSAGACNSVNRITACSSIVGMSFAETPTGVNQPLNDGGFFDNNVFYNFGGAGVTGLSFAYTHALVRGISICGNVFEKTTTPGHTIGVANAATGTIGTTNVIMENNATMGGNAGFAFCYVSNSVHTQWQWKNNSFGSKLAGGSFEAITDNSSEGTPSGTKQGNWGFVYGVGFSGNYVAWYQQPTQFYGTNTVYGSQPSYVSDKSYNNGAAGQGDYHLTAASIATRIGDNAVPFDLAGMSRNPTDAAGAYHFGGAYAGFWLL